MTTVMTIPMAVPSVIETRSSRWLGVVTHTDPRYGGLSTAVPRLGLGLAGAGGVETWLAAFCAPGEEFPPEGYDEAHLSFWPVSRRQWMSSRALRARFAAEVRRVDGMHIHGLWEASTAVASRVARELDRPYVLSAHGMLEPWALHNKRLKKLVYAALVERRTVGGAACLHALTQAEAEQYRAFGARGPIAVIPNAVETPQGLSPELFLEQFPELKGKRLVLFLGRLHPKKGLHLLIEAWAHIARSYPEAQLVLSGPDSEGTAAKLKAAIRSADIEPSVTFTGMLDGESKWNALAAAECFVLPSLSEGLSMSVLEAMGVGVPVIVTRACNMPEISRFEAGWEIAPSAAELSTALGELLRVQPGENRAMGERGAALIASRYTPQRIAAEMAEVYKFVLNGTAPSTVELLVANPGDRTFAERGSGGRRHGAR